MKKNVACSAQPRPKRDARPIGHYDAGARGQYVRRGDRVGSLFRTRTRRGSDLESSAVAWRGKRVPARTSTIIRASPLQLRYRNDTAGGSTPSRVRVPEEVLFWDAF